MKSLRSDKKEQAIKKSVGNDQHLLPSAKWTLKWSHGCKSSRERKKNRKNNHEPDYSEHAVSCSNLIFSRIAQPIQNEVKKKKYCGTSSRSRIGSEKKRIGIKAFCAWTQSAEDSSVKVWAATYGKSNLQAHRTRSKFCIKTWNLISNFQESTNQWAILGRINWNVPEILAIRC